ncbi:hypothetical protein KSS87_009041 [Heliosperma pusillum]|nr:hypothetical protein KSS87_003458 [Heliosperma pusillum]KAH9625283.1 hypothetical protein KSS87_009041 [Heliosperma pusillum]
MAFYHHNNHHLNHHLNHHSTTTTCCCNHPSPPQQQPPLQHCSSSSSDPFVIATIVSQLLQSQSQLPLNYSINPTNPTSISTNHTNPFNLSSLVHRIDNLESSLHHLSSKNHSLKKKNGSFYVKEAAARVIQSHFRVFLVRRSRVLRQIKVLANVKSNLNRIKSKFSDHGFVDFDFVSHSAMDLLILVDSIQGEDQMIRDSKKSVTREIVQFLELIDEVCAKKHQLMTRKIKTMRLVRNDKARNGHDSKGYSERAGGSKSRNVDNDKRLIANLRERVERIGKMSRALEADEVVDDEMEGFEHISDGNGGNFDHVRAKYGLNNEVHLNKSAPLSDGKKRVCFVEDGKTIRVYNVDGDKIIGARDMEEIEESTKVREEEEEEEDDDDEEAQSDGQQSTQSSEDVTSSKSYEVNGNHNDDKEFTFPAQEPLKGGARAEFSTRKPGVKIAG